MRLTFAEERWNDIVEELKALFVLHVQEDALRHPRNALDVNYEAFAARDREGILSVTTARAHAELVGYFINYVVYHPHYRTVLHGCMDTYFLAPAHRNAANGLRLIAAGEAFMRARGARELMATTKTGLDISELFERLGWRRGAIAYAKSLEA